MVSINLPRKDSLNEIINKMNSLKDKSIGIDTKIEVEEDSSSESYDMALPYDFYAGSVVIYNNELHILGSYVTANRTMHYKYDGTSWTSVSTLPYGFYNGSAVVYNNEIHILGGTGATTKHYKFNGSSWTSVSKLPYAFTFGGVVVYNNTIHILGGYSSSYRTKHYKLNGASWTSVSTLPYSFYYGTATVYNNEIHILGGTGGNTKHYKYSGSWTSVNTIPYAFVYGTAVVYNESLHILGSNNSSNYTKHYKLNGNSWVSASTLPYNFYRGGAIVYNNEIYILGSANASALYKNFYKWNETSWTNIIIISKLKYLFKYFLPKNTKILCDKTALFQDTETSDSSTGVTLTENTNGYTVSATGNVRLLSIVDSTEIQLAHSIVYE